MAKDEKRERQLEILLDELEGARALVEHHQDARVRCMRWGSLLMLGLLLLGYTTWTPAGVAIAVCPMASLALPFVAIYLLVQYGFHTHYIIRGRAYASGLEESINAELGESLLIAEALESKISGPLGKPHFLGISAGNFTGMVSAATIHYLIICFVMFVAGWMHTENFIFKNQAINPVGRLAESYSTFLVLWTVINVVYLLYNFLTNSEEKTLIAAVRQEYQPKE